MINEYKYGGYGAAERYNNMTDTIVNEITLPLSDEQARQLATIPQGSADHTHTYNVEGPADHTHTFSAPDKVIEADIN